MGFSELKAVIRNLGRKRFISLAKVFGLVVGFTVFIFLSEKIQYETSYDQFWEEASSTYRVALDLTYEDGEELLSAKNFPGAAQLFDQELEEVVSHCNFGKDVVTVFNGPEQKFQDVDFVWTDPTFFDVFKRKIIASNTPSPLENIHGLAISESFAKKLFGTDNPLGKEISVNEGWKYVVDTVFEDIPSNSHMKIDMVGTYKTLFYYLQNFDNTRQVLVENDQYRYEKPSPYELRRWRNPVQYRPYGYIKLRKGASINAVASQTQTLLDKVALPEYLKDARMQFIFQPITDIHLTSKLNHEMSANGESKQIVFLGIIIAVVLLVCLINFIGLNTITTMENAKNYSIRLLNGSKYKQVFQLMLTETALLNFLAILMAIPLAIVIIHSQIPSVSISQSTGLWLTALVLGSVMVSSLVPFFSVVKNNAFHVITSGKQSLGQKWTGQKVMVTFQFSITIILIICTIGIYKQMQFMMNSNLGFNGHQTLYSFTPMTMNQHPDIPKKLTTFRNEVEKLGGIASFSASSSIPGKPIARLNDQVKPLGDAEPYPATFNEVSIDDRYIDAYGVNLLAGENLLLQNDWISNEVLLNETASSRMGYNSPIDAVGESITIGNREYEIKGVVEDYHHVSLHTKVTPTIYHQNLYWDHSVGYYSFRIASDRIAETMQQVSQIWNQLYPKEEFIYSFSNKAYALQYEQDQKFNQILSYSTILALFVSCLGLWAVALFNTKKRVKEIGIRKVNGASIGQILKLLNRDFMKWVALAFFIAVPISWSAMDTWLENFAYKAEISWWIFALGGLVALLLALLTVSWQSFKAAIANPVDALRNQ